jgi:hypothetical protein
MAIGLRGVLLASALLVAGLSSQVAAAPINDFSTTRTDLYYGGKNQYSPGGVGDVIGDSNFDTTSADISKSGNTLTVVVHTNYAATVGANNVGALGTSVGSLFIGLGSPTFNNGGTANPIAAPYAYDTFTADPGRFDYAFVPSTSNTNAALYQLNGTGSDVQLAYYPDTNTTSGTNFRNNQAVGYKGNAAPESGVAGSSWALDKVNKTITFTILNFFSLSAVANMQDNALTLAWAMTCANDVLLVTVPIRRDLPDVPVPASVVFMLTGLAGLAGLKRLKGTSATKAA